MGKQGQLTEGAVSRRLLRFFFPMLLTSLLQQAYAVADAAIVGKGLGDAALAAVGNLSSLNILLIGFATGMTQGFSVVIARHDGAGDGGATRRSAALSVRLSVALSAVLTAASCLLLEPALRCMRTDPLILRDSLRYGTIVFGCLTVTVGYNLFSGVLRALGDSRTPFVAIVASSAVNILLDVLFIFGLRTGVEGAAIATIIAQGLSVGICAGKMRRLNRLRLTREDFAPDASMSRALLGSGVPMALMNCTIAAGNMIVQGYVNSLGVAYTSAYAACNQLLGLMILPATTAGYAASAFVSQNDGAGRLDRVRAGMRVCLLIAAVSYGLLGSAMCFLPRQLVGLMLSEGETIALAARYMRICGAQLFLVNFLFVFRNGVQGLGCPVIPMCSGVMEMALRIPAIILLLPAAGFGAIAWAEVAAWIGSLALNATAYARLIRSRVRGADRPA